MHPRDRYHSWQGCKEECGREYPYPYAYWQGCEEYPGPQHPYWQGCAEDNYGDDE